MDFVSENEILSSGFIFKIVTRRDGIINEMANGVDIQIDVLAIAKKKENVKLFFIEAKKTQLTLRDLGQLWSYCKLVVPEESFLMSSLGLGSLNKLLNAFRREDLLDFGDGKKIKKMKIAKWDIRTNAPDMVSMIPKI
jgi:hypothetical protein